VLRVAKSMLEEIGLSVIPALDGTRAVEIFRERADEIELILLDLTMPGMDGEATYRKLRAVSPQARVVLVSGYAEQEVSRRFEEGDGPAGFLQKPFTVAALSDKLREILER
jgi:CheY-like chemotaxis protein